LTIEEQGSEGGRLGAGAAHGRGASPRRKKSFFVCAPCLGAALNRLPDPVGAGRGPSRFLAALLVRPPKWKYCSLGAGSPPGCAPLHTLPAGALAIVARVGRPRRPRPRVFRASLTNSSVEWAVVDHHRVSGGCPHAGLATGGELSPLPNPRPAVAAGGCPLPTLVPDPDQK